MYESYSKRLRLLDTFSLRGDTMYISIAATNLLPATIRATFLTQFGSLQLDGGRGQLWHLGNKRLGSLDRNWSFVESCVYPYVRRALSVSAVPLACGRTAPNALPVPSPRAGRISTLCVTSR